MGGVGGSVFLFQCLGLLFKPLHSQEAERLKKHGNHAEDASREIILHHQQRDRPGHDDGAQNQQQNRHFAAPQAGQGLTVSVDHFHSRRYVHVREGILLCRGQGSAGEHLVFHLQGVPLVPEGAQLLELLFRVLLRGQLFAGGFPDGEQILRLFQRFPRLGDPPGVCLCGGIVQGGLMGVQLLKPGFDVVQTHFQLLYLGVQRIQFVNFILKGVPLAFQLGKKAAFVVAAAVFQIPEVFCQPVPCAAFVAGGHQVIQAAAEGFILGHGQVRLTDKPRPAEHRLLHAQQLLAAVCRRQLRDGQPGIGFVGLEFTQGNSAFGAALDGDVPAVPI